MSVTLLLWERRLVCGDCGRKSRQTQGAGDMIATPDGWRCERCVPGTPPSDLNPNPVEGSDLCAD